MKRSLPSSTDTRISSLLIANRGEIAVRVIRAARELGVRTVAIYADGDERALHTRLADEAWRIPSSLPMPYLDGKAILDVAARTGTSAIHPGYGFLAENAEFARACSEADLIFVGPSAAAIAAMGDKIEARRIAARAGVPVVTGSDGPVRSVAEALEWSEQVGYPIAVKASAGGGGRGFRVARGPAEMEAAFLGATSEATRSFANPEVYLERYLDDPRHIEVQLMADRYGNVVAVGDRDCSIQRRHQKLIEEAPAPNVPAQTRVAMAEAVVSLARAVDYEGAGTVEFLLDADGSFAFLEMNTRIQVEHPVTEMTTGIDLVREQILAAGGAPLSFTASDVVPRGHAIECRINAEDPGRGFAPTPGSIERFHAPGGMGIRVDSAAERGETILPTYDSLIAKVIAWGRDRGEAADRMCAALSELEITGLPTTRDFHLRVLENPEWRAGAVTTAFIDRHPQVIPPPVNVNFTGEAGREEPVEVIAEVEGHRFQVRVHAAIAAGSSRATSQRRPGVPRQAHALGATGNGKVLRSPIQGTVVRVNLQLGDQVRRGQTVCVVEAMKMENDVAAHRDGAVISIAAAPGAAVRIGDPLAEIG